MPLPEHLAAIIASVWLPGFQHEHQSGMSCRPLCSHLHGYARQLSDD